MINYLLSNLRYTSTVRLYAEPSTPGSTPLPSYGLHPRGGSRNGPLVATGTSTLKGKSTAADAAWTLCEAAVFATCLASEGHQGASLPLEWSVTVLS